MRILVTNDDGVHAEGIKVLAEALKVLGEVCIVAPLEERSTTGHTVTLDTPLRISQVDERVYGCSGYPADCVLMGIGSSLFDEGSFDLVVSGINRGANLGQDMYYSGTVAAAREAVFHGIRAIAVSTDIDFSRPNLKIHYQTAAAFMVELISSGLHWSLPPQTLVNVNVPNLSATEIKGVKLTSMGFRKYSEEIDHRIDCRSRPYYWVAGTYEGFLPLGGSTDCEAVEDGHISVTPLKLVNPLAETDEQWGEKLRKLKVV